MLWVRSSIADVVESVAADMFLGEYTIEARLTRQKKRAYGREKFDEVGGPNVIGRSLCFAPATNAGGRQWRRCY